MGTTSARLGLDLLDGLESLEASYALLHNEADVTALKIQSDIDVAVSANPLALIRQLSTLLADRAAPLVVWNYDVNSWTSFWFSPDLSEGAQLDFLQDPRGLGKYGLRTEVILSRRVRGQRFWTLDSTSAAIYSASKRAYKNDAARLGTALGELQSHGDWHRSVSEVLSGRRHAVLSRLLAADTGNRTLGDHLRRVPARGLRRVTGRLLRPIGYAGVLADEDYDEMVGPLCSKISPVLLSCERMSLTSAGALAQVHRNLRRPTVSVLRRSEFARFRRLLPTSSIIDLDMSDPADVGHHFYQQAAALTGRRLSRKGFP